MHDGLSYALDVTLVSGGGLPSQALELRDLTTNPNENVNIFSKTSFTRGQNLRVTFKFWKDGTNQYVGLHGPWAAARYG